MNNFFEVCLMRYLVGLYKSNLDATESLSTMTTVTQERSFIEAA